MLKAWVYLSVCPSTCVSQSQYVLSEPLNVSSHIQHIFYDNEVIIVMLLVFRTVNHCNVLLISYLLHLAKH